MKNRTSLQAFLLPVSIACGLASAPGIYGQDKVEIHGRVLIDEEHQEGTFEVLEVGNWICKPLEVFPDGRFNLKLNAGERAYLRFEQEGFLTKEVLVDTRNANITKAAARKNKSLKFDVQMTPVLPDKQLAYAGPVGIITYLKGTGLMKVKYDRSLVRTGNGDIVENAARR
ncbi:MAG: hypothetical protein JST38_21265 [Bacteroidetes bacterium]|nr:hypothetical protein [Bacteroidota bacterium]